ncbi:hypothetical protein GXB85_14695 [Cellulomonas sp. APG4]|uniref:hypothetical protein n=1 Tax=Cellulomonas sp. APG4 TaxID=1538656 RepID=UPI00137AF7B0|nr:hypothetical protein [Cellulomonas sp. APG4]NCT92190.1 hypothetical protein [Cellulomonas sp. APG4]
MGLRSSLGQRLENRWYLRSAVARGLPALGSELDHTVVVPTGRDGRPGYRIRATAPSSGLREPSTGQSTSDFLLKYSARGHLVGTCWGRSDALGLQARAARAVQHVTGQHHGATCIQIPEDTRIAGESAVAYTVVVGVVRVTDWLFDHGGWAFTIGRFHDPDDGDAVLATADRMLASWEWLDGSASR